LRRLIIVTVLFAPLLLSACNTGVDSAEVWASDYDQSCASPLDCAVVTEGDYCGCVGCPNAAVSKSAQAQFASDAAAADASCKEEVVCGDLVEERAQQAASCVQPLAVCDQGTCAARLPEAVDGPVVDVVDRACSVDDDCTVVPAIFDEPCACKVAVSRAGADMAERIAMSRNHSDSCACEDGSVESECVEGTCQLTVDECEIAAWSPEQCE
jgi:hypothetical protein